MFAAHTTAPRAKLTLCFHFVELPVDESAAAGPSVASRVTFSNRVSERLLIGRSFGLHSTSVRFERSLYTSPAFGKTSSSASDIFDYDRMRQPRQS